MISVLCMGVWFIAVSNHMEEARRCRRQLPRQRVVGESECYSVTTSLRYVCEDTRDDGQEGGYVEG
jgi:hypothetical protein